MATVETFGMLTTKGALVVTAFPTTGAAAPIAAQFLVRQLALPLVGQIRLEELDHMMAVRDGRATSVIRIFGGQLACGLDQACPSLLVITTEVPLPPPLLEEAAEAILDWAKRDQIHILLALEGVALGDASGERRVLGAATSDEVLAELEGAGVTPASQAFIAGLSAQLVLAAADHHVRAAAIMVEADQGSPDGRAAAALISALDRLIPEVAMDAEPLLKEALRIEDEVRKQAPAQATRPGVQHTFI